jgi:hypothetical protein
MQLSDKLGHAECDRTTTTRMCAPRFVVLLLALAASSLSIAAGAFAECDCAEVSNKQSFKCHRAVFIGTVVEGSFISNVEVEEVFKGQLPNSVLVDTSGECRIWFEKGKRYLFEIYNEADSSTLKTSICSHTRPLEDRRTLALIAELRRWAWWWRLPLSGVCRQR